MKKLKMVQVVFFVALALIISSCGSSRQISRIDSNETVDLSGNWNDTDSRLVAEEMITDVIGRNWLSEFQIAKSAKPVVIVGEIRNKSSEHINVETFIKDIEKELINSGKIRFVATAEEREQIRAERKDQGDFASDETMKKFYRELGADFLMSGVISSINDKYEGEEVKFYQIDLQLINIETNEKVWIGDKKIKKYISSSEYSR
jgi:hypothetical protein